MKRIAYIVLASVFILIVSFVALRMYTKSHSPSEVVSYEEIIEVTYSRPYKKKREIFGDLVPYGEVWRTGANEATVFSTEVPLVFADQVLPPGEYSLWTIPGEEQWEVIFNEETGQWGIDMSGVANRNPERDVVRISAPVIETKDTFDQFTITFHSMKEELELILAWDQTMISVPFRRE